MGTTQFNSILSTGVHAGASDWHIREDCTVVLRVDGTLVEIEDFSTSHDFLIKAVGEITTPVNLEEYEKTGDSDFAFVEEGVGRFRVNLHKQRGAMALTFRHVKDNVPPLETLGLPKIIHEIAGKHRGIILVTGTTGSGKSTTMAAMLEFMNTNMNRHIITIEDPIEYAFSDKQCVFQQREVNIDVISFESALVHALRQDPDVIVVGEMRDRSSFESALTAADTGHLVISTLHTRDASQTITRILDFYDHQERDAIRKALATNLTAIICQRLIPKAVGKGVVPCNEIMIQNATIKKLLEEDNLATLEGAIEAGRGEGMMSFNQRLVDLVNEGLITEEDALDNANNPEALTMKLSGIDVGTDNGILG